MHMHRRAPAASAEERAAERERQKAEKKAERERKKRETAERKCGAPSTPWRDVRRLQGCCSLLAALVGSSPAARWPCHIMCNLGLILLSADMLGERGSCAPLDDGHHWRARGAGRARRRRKKRARRRSGSSASATRVRPLWGPPASSLLDVKCMHACQRFPLGLGLGSLDPYLLHRPPPLCQPSEQPSAAH